MSKPPTPFPVFSPRLPDATHEDMHGITPIYTAQDIRIRLNEMADQIANWYDEPPIAQIIMNGAYIFAADLVRALSARGLVIEMDFIHLEKEKRKRGDKTPPLVHLRAGCQRPVEGRDVLIIDDIFETGHTLAAATSHFMSLGANRVSSVILLDKSQGRHTLCDPDMIGFTCPDVFVIGYGMDMAHRYRELPFIGKMGQA